MNHAKYCTCFGSDITALMFHYAYSSNTFITFPANWWTDEWFLNHVLDSVRDLDLLFTGESLILKRLK